MLDEVFQKMAESNKPLFAHMNQVSKLIWRSLKEGV
jgi:hypothetical protein